MVSAFWYNFLYIYILTGVGQQASWRTVGWVCEENDEEEDHT